MLRRRDARNALCEFVDEIIALVFIGARQCLDLPPRLFVFQFVAMHQRHRMNLNPIGDNEFDPRQADAVARQLPPAKRTARARDVEHD